MGRLAELTAQLEAAQKGVEYKTPETKMDDHIQSIVKAIHGIQLNIDSQEGYDYTPEIQALGDAVKKALKAHGDDLVRAMSGISVNVSAPNVNVDSPITFSPEIELPESKAVKFSVFDTEGRLTRTVIAEPYVEEEKPASKIDID